MLVGFTGSMVADRINGPDRCYWYKADRYYPDGAVVLPAADRRTTLPPDFTPAPSEPWYELAPLGRCWYTIGNRPLFSRQEFDPSQAALSSHVESSTGVVDVTTFLHGTLPVLVERFEAPVPLRMRLLCAPGVWSADSHDVQPFRSARMQSGPQPVISYRLGLNQITMSMLVEPTPLRWGGDEETAWIEAEGTRIIRYFIIIDEREERIQPGGKGIDGVSAQVTRHGYEVLWRSHVEFWDRYRQQGSTIEGDDPALGRVYAFTAYQMKASQHPISGAIPVNNLRATWSSHVFWDAGFMHLAMLQMGHTHEARLGCRFLERLFPVAEEHARAYGAAGIKYDWELTHEGRPAYGAHRHLVHQVHNNAMFSLMCWHQYTYTRDMEVLRALYPIVKGIAEFFLTGVVRPGPTLRAVTGIAELAPPVSVDTATLAGTIRALEIAASAAQILQRDDEFTQRCLGTASGLRHLVTTLIIDGTLRASDRAELSWGVLPACSLMGTLSPDDPVVLRTARAFAAMNANPAHGILGHGAGGRGPRDGYPWVAGWISSILAAAGAPEEAWAVLQPLRSGVCIHGGLPEKVYDDGRWNMQYFTTAQAALCVALQALIVQPYETGVRVTAPPWRREGTFHNLHLNGFAVSGAWAGSNITVCSIRNVSAAVLAGPAHVNGLMHSVSLRPGETYTWA